MSLVAYLKSIQGIKISKEYQIDEILEQLEDYNSQLERMQEDIREAPFLDDEAVNARLEMEKTIDEAIDFPMNT